MGPLACCICGGGFVVKHCDECNHDFCRHCRKRLFWRGVLAVREYLTDEPPKHCKCRIKKSKCCGRKGAE